MSALPPPQSMKEDLRDLVVSAAERWYEMRHLDSPGRERRALCATWTCWCGQDNERQAAEVHLVGAVRAFLKEPEAS